MSSKLCCCPDIFSWEKKRTLRCGNKLAELQKAENHLRYTVNAAVWLEVCLLNLMPSLLPVSATKTLSAKPVNDKGHDSKLLPTVATNTPNLAQIWQQVMDTAKPSNQNLLAHAHLVKLQGNKAILEVTPAYLKKFERSKEAIALMLQRATQSQQPMTVLIKTANKSSNGRVKA